MRAEERGRAESRAVHLLRCAGSSLAELRVRLKASCLPAGEGAQVRWEPQLSITKMEMRRKFLFSTFSMLSHLAR